MISWNKIMDYNYKPYYKNVKKRTVMVYTRKAEKSFVGLSVTLLAVIVTAVLGQNISDVPPVVVIGPPPHKLFNAALTVDLVLPCEAMGTPPLNFTWLKDGIVMHPSTTDGNAFNLHTGPYLLNDGSLILTRPVEGVYQCLVKNDWGTAMSNMTYLQATAFPSSYRAPKTVTHHVKAGSMFTLDCGFSGLSIPPPYYSWEITKCRRGCLSSKKVEITERISIKDNGSLVFAYILESDSQDNYIYKCSVHNSMRKKTLYSGYAQINVISNTHYMTNTIAPSLIYATPSPVTVLEGEHVLLTCFFNSWPSAHVTWSKDQQNLTEDADQDDISYTFDIFDAQKSNEGVYQCTGTNKVQSVSQSIRVVVEAAPKIEVGPQMRRAMSGEKVNFHCIASGTPPPNIQWYINAVPYQESKKDHQWYVKEQGTVLTLDKANINSASSVQCNASNIHGYRLASAYFVVQMPRPELLTSTIVINPADVQHMDITTVQPASSSVEITTTEINPSSPTNMHASADNIIDKPRLTKNKDVKKTVNKSYVLDNYVKGDQKNVNFSHRQGDGIRIKPSSNSWMALPIFIAIAVFIMMLVTVIIFRRRQRATYSLNPPREPRGADVTSAISLVPAIQTRNEYFTDDLWPQNAASAQYEYASPEERMGWVTHQISTRV